MPRQLLVFMVLLLVACDDGSGGGGGADGGGAGGSGGGGGGGELPPSDPFDPGALAEVYAEAFCNHLAACAPAIAEFAGLTPAVCRAETTETWRRVLAAIEPLIEARRTAFSQAGFDACINALQAASQDCHDGVDPRDCAGFFVGGRQVGEGCSSSNECPADAFCQREVPATCGLCETVAKAGESCVGLVCEHGTRCFETPDGPRCISVTRALGEACGTAETGLCRGQLQCVGEAERTCVAPAGPGEPCDPTGVAADCNIEAGFFCGPEDRCVELMFGEPGSECGAASATLCGDQLACVGGRCEALPGMGEPCGPDGCLDGLACNGVTCQPLGATGDACRSDDDCAEPGACLDGTCGPLRYPTDCAP